MRVSLTMTHKEKKKKKERHFLIEALPSVLRPYVSQ